MSNAPLIDIQKVCFNAINQSGVTLKIARLDKVNALASGNKIYKLAPIMAYAKANNIKQIISFGGAYSNHIHALALLTQQQGLESIGIIRGESHSAQNPTLQDVINAKMKLLFIDRKAYKKRNDQDYLAQLQSQYPDALIIPEGGSHKLGIQGCKKLVNDINQNHQTATFAVACGTGATAAGMVCGLVKGQSLHAYSVLKDASMASRIKNFVTSAGTTDFDNYTVHSSDYGGYAKFDKSLLDFVLDFHAQTDILLDPIYTSKMCRKLIEQLQKGQFKQHESIIMVHSGGLQGWRGLQKRVINLGGDDMWRLIASHLET